MLVRKDGATNQPVCESVDIVKYMDENYEGIKLMGPINKEPVYKDRFNKLMDCYNAFNPAGYTFPSAQE